MPITVTATPSSVTTPPPKEVIVEASGGVPPYVLDVNTPSGVTATVSGSSPTWSVILSGNGSGQAVAIARDQHGDVGTRAIQVN